MLITSAASEPEASERDSSLIDKRLHCRGLAIIFLAKHKKLRSAVRSKAQEVVVKCEWKV